MTNPPKILYAALDEAPIVEGDNVLFEFSGVAASSFDGLAGLTPAEWRRRWRAQFASGRKLQGVGAIALFESLETFYVEFQLPSENIYARRWISAWQNNRQKLTWYRLEMASAEDKPRLSAFAYQYGADAALPLPLISVAQVPRTLATRLSAAFSMKTWPSASLTQIETVLQGADPGAMTVVDVGQGNACGLHRYEGEGVNFWIDLGCGFSRNAHTRPPGLELCTEISNAPVLLTHWDKDHWYGARVAAPANDKKTFLRRTWIVPRQLITATHTKLAVDILANGGQILVLDDKSAGVTFPLKVETTSKNRIEIALGSGADANDRNNCECLIVRIFSLHGAKIWLLPGDASYSKMPPSWQRRSYRAIVASHHGADVGKAGIPSPLDDQAILAFSFGPDNRHGVASTSHPRHTMTLHYNQKWDLNKWVSSGVSGNTSPNLPACATAKHNPKPTPMAKYGGTHLGDIVIRWK